MVKEKKSFRVLELIPPESHSSKPTELIQIRGHEALTMNARRSITILWHNAHRQGIEINKTYTIEIDALVPPKHKGYEMVIDAVRALMTTLIEINKPDGSTSRVQFLGGNNMTAKDRPAGTMTYRFDQELIEILQDSRIWGKISLPELMALNSKYAIPLYENVSQWTGLTNKTSQVFELEDFRALLGVEHGKYDKFGDLNRRVLVPAVSEINALAPFNLALLPIKSGRAVTHVRLSWWLKDHEEQKAAWSELHTSRVGRRARASDQAEMVLDPSPSPGRLARRAFRDHLIDD